MKSEIEAGEACRKELSPAEKENRLLRKLEIDGKVEPEVNRELLKKKFGTSDRIRTYVFPSHRPDSLIR